MPTSSDPAIGIIFNFSLLPPIIICLSECRLLLCRYYNKRFIKKNPCNEKLKHYLN